MITDYFTRLTGLNPTKDQIKVLNNIVNHDRVLISAGRQSGKTITVALAAMYLAYEYEQPLKILLISAQENVVYWYMRCFFREHADLQAGLVGKSSTYIVPATGFQLTKGTHVFVTGITERSIRGIPADVVIIDEAYLVPNESILTAMGNLSGGVSKLILLSTPGHDKDSLFMKWLDTDKFKVMHWSSEKLPWHKQIIKTKRQEYDEVKWATEVLGRAPTEEERSNSGDIIGKVIFGTAMKDICRIEV